MADVKNSDASPPLELKESDFKGNAYRANMALQQLASRIGAVEASVTVSASTATVSAVASDDQVDQNDQPVNY